MEITFAGLEDDLPNLDELRLAWKERAELATKKYRNSEKGQASLDKRKYELKEAYRTDEEFRESRLSYSKQYTASGKQAIARAKYKASAKGKSTDKAYRNSEATKAKKNESQRRRRAAAKAKKQLEVEAEGCDGEGLFGCGRQCHQGQLEVQLYRYVHAVQLSCAEIEGHEFRGIYSV
jgi:hypothetical protein